MIENAARCCLQPNREHPEGEPCVIVDRLTKRIVIMETTQTRIFAGLLLLIAMGFAENGASLLKWAGYLP